MARFRFNMQNYLSLKEKLEDQKKMEYGLASAKVEEEKQKKLEIEAHKAAVAEDFRKEKATTFDPVIFQMYNRYIDDLSEKIVVQAEVVIQAEKAAEEKRLELIEAMKERKMLDRLKEKAFEEYVTEEKKAEQKVIDELVSYRYN